MTDQTAAEDVAATLELLAEPTMKHGKWILSQLAQQVRALADELSRLSQWQARELTAAQAAIQRVREHGARELSDPCCSECVATTQGFLRALDGDTAEEGR